MDNMNRTADQIAAQYGTAITMTNGEPVTATALPTAQARMMVRDLESAGYEASDAPDHEDRQTAWVYVSLDLANRL